LISLYLKKGGIHGPTVEVTTPSHLSSGILTPSAHGTETEMMPALFLWA